MKVNVGEIFAQNKFYSVTVTFNEDTDNEVYIDVTVCTSESEYESEGITEITVINPEDIPEGYCMDDVIYEVEQNFFN